MTTPLLQLPLRMRRTWYVICLLRNIITELCKCDRIEVASQIPVFVWAPEEEGQFQPGRYSRWWTKHSVAPFQKLLQQLGSNLILRRSTETSKALLQLVQETGAQAVYFNHLYDPISLVRDHEVKQALSKLGIICRSYNADLLYEPWEVLDENDQPFTCFDAYWDK